MRKVVIFSIAGLFMASGVAYAEGECGHFENAESESQTVATQTNQTTKPATVDSKG